MDIPDICPGSITYLPVRSPRARIFIGDAHAIQGDGELCGTGVEFATHTTIHVELIKSWGINWLRLENEQVMMAIGSARPLEDAVRIAYRELVLWMEKEYGFDRWGAYMLLTECGIVRVGNFVDPKYSVGASVSKNYLFEGLTSRTAIHRDKKSRSGPVFDGRLEGFDRHVVWGKDPFLRAREANLLPGEGWR